MSGDTAPYRTTIVTELVSAGIPSKAHAIAVRKSSDAGKTACIAAIGNAVWGFEHTIRPKQAIGSYKIGNCLKMTDRTSDSLHSGF